MADDFKANARTTGTVEVGGSATGEIEARRDIDWFAVELVAGRTYVIDLEGSPSGGGTLKDAMLRGLYDARGQNIARTRNDNGGEGADARLTFTATESGTHYIAARSGGPGTGTYTVRVTEVDDFTADTGTAGTVEVGGSATGEIETSRDIDWFAVELVAGQVYVIDLEGSPGGGGTLGDAMLRGLHDAQGKRIAGTRNDNGGEGADARLTFTATESGTHYIAARSQGGETGSYTVRVTADPDATATGATDLGDLAALDRARVQKGSVDGATDGTDYYRFTLSEAQQVTLALRRQDADADLHLEDENGTVLHSSTRKGTRNEGIEATLEAGTYYVRVAAREEGENAYNLRYGAAPPPPPPPANVSEPEGQDFSADISTEGRVLVGGSATGEIDTGGDRDWFAVDLEAGKTYRIDQKGGWTGDGTLWDPQIYGIHDADGKYIADTGNDDGWTRLSARTFLTPADTATYYVAAGAHAMKQGTYTLSVAEVGADDFYADTGTAGTVAVGGSATGEIERPGDRDWFLVTLDAGKTYRIDLKGYKTGDGSMNKPYLRGIHDAMGNLIDGTSNDDVYVRTSLAASGPLQNSRVFFSPSADATNYVYYVAAGGQDQSTGTYTLSVAEIPDDFTAGTDTTGTVAVGGSAAGKIDFPREADWFAVTLEAGKTYRIDLKGSSTGDGTLKNPYLRGVYDASGNLLAGTGDDNGGSGLNGQTFIAPAKTATYYVAAGGHANEQGTYTLSIAEVEGDDDFAAGTGTAGTVAVGGSVTGEVERPGDRDWFAVSLEKGKNYQVDLKGFGTGDGTLDDPYLHGIHDAQGNLVVGTTDDNGGDGLNSGLLFAPTQSGTYYVAAGNQGDHAGTYTLSVTEIPDDLAADTSTEGRVSVGGSAASEIERPGDRDWFAVDLEAGKTYRIDQKGGWTGDGTLWDPQIYGIHDTDGKYIANSGIDDGGARLNARKFFTPAEAGTYYVAAGGHAIKIGTYTLSVAEVGADDFAAGTGTAGTVAVGGSATGEIERPGDRDWIAVTLEAGKTYRIDLKGHGTGDGTMTNPHLRGIHDATGSLIDGTSNDDVYISRTWADYGPHYNSRVTFAPTEDATYYVAASGHDQSTGTYTLSVEEIMDAM